MPSRLTPSANDSRRFPSHHPTSIFLLLVVLFSALTACGSGEAVDAGAPDDEPVLPETTEEETPMTDDQTSDRYTPLTARSDLISLEPGTITEIVVDPDDDRRLLLHFQGAAEPCSGAAVSVEETETTVVVDFRIGLDPNVAAMTCIDQVFDYEIVIPLDAPLGNRTINLAG